MSRIRVLEVGKSTAGIGSYLRYLAYGLDKTKFHLTFVCLSEGGTELAEELKKVAGIHALSWQMNRFKIDVFSDIILTFRLVRLIRTDTFDVIHAHGSKAGFLVRIAAMGSGIPVIYSPHCFSFHEGEGRVRAMLFAVLERFAARFLTARIVTVADGEQKLARQYHVGKPHQFVTVRNGVSADNYQISVDRDMVKASLNIPKEKPLVGAVGRLGKQKDPLTFVRMAGIVHAQMPDVNFVWVGIGPLWADAKQLAFDLGLQDYVHFVGERKDIPIILKAIDCFVLPSLWEGLSIVLLEAMATGLPVVASDIPGNDEVITNGVTGWLVPVSNAPALANGVMDLLQTPARALSFSQEAYNHVCRNFTIAQMLTAIERIYLEVYKNNGRLPDVE